MANVIIENIVQIAATLLITLIGVLGTWLTTKLVKRTELKNISTATGEVVSAAQQTVLELQQTVVDQLKAASADGKLSKAEISDLGKLLLAGTKEKMSDTTINLLNAAGVDVDALILARRLSIASRPSNSNCPSRFLRAGRGFFFLPFCGAFLRLWR